MSEQIDPEVLAMHMWKRQVAALDVCVQMAPKIVLALEDMQGVDFSSPVESQTASKPYEPPITVAEPIYNDQGFSAGFRVMHPPGVECAFSPDTEQCSCGKMDLGVVHD